jgi:protein LTV1
VNKGVARNENESKEEKKKRKEAVKQERRDRRQFKKNLKAAFKNETYRQTKLLPNERLQGHSVQL